MRRKKKTAIKKLLNKLEERQRLVKNIDDEEAYYLSLVIGIAEQYLIDEQKQIITAYKDGLDDMKRLCYWRPKEYFEEYYGNN